MKQYFLTESSAKVIRELVRERDGNIATGNTIGAAAPQETYVGKVVSATMPAISGTTPGLGHVDIYQLDDSNNLIPTTFTGELCFNLSNRTLSVGAFVLTSRDPYSGKKMTTGIPTGYTGVRTLVEDVACVSGHNMLTTFDYSWVNGLLISVT